MILATSSGLQAGVVDNAWDVVTYIAIDLAQPGTAGDSAGAAPAQSSSNGTPGTAANAASPSAAAPALEAGA